MTNTGIDISSLAETFASLGIEASSSAIEKARLQHVELETRVMDLTIEHDRICGERNVAMADLAKLHAVGHLLNGGKCPFADCRVDGAPTNPSPAHPKSAPELIISVLHKSYPESMSLPKLRAAMEEGGWSTKADNAMNLLTATVGRMHRDGKIERPKRGHYLWKASDTCSHTGDSEEVAA